MKLNEAYELMLNKNETLTINDLRKMSQVKESKDVYYYRLIEKIIKHENTDKDLREEIYYKLINNLEKYSLLIADIVSYKDTNQIIKYEALNFNNENINYYMIENSDYNLFNNIINRSLNSNPICVLPLSKGLKSEYMSAELIEKIYNKKEILNETMILNIIANEKTPKHILYDIIENSKIYQEINYNAKIKLCKTKDDFINLRNEVDNEMNKVVQSKKNFIQSLDIAYDIVKNGLNPVKSFDTPEIKEFIKMFHTYNGFKDDCYKNIKNSINSKGNVLIMELSKIQTILDYELLDKKYIDQNIENYTNDLSFVGESFKKSQELSSQDYEDFRR